MITPGKYEARIVNYDITEDKKGNPQVAVLFSFTDQEGPKEYTWYGGLSTEGGRKVTLKALLTMGFKGKNVADLAGGVESHALNVSTPVEIDIQNEDYQGKVYTKVKWINRLGGAKFANALSKQEAKAKLAALNLDGELAAIRAETGNNVQPIKKAAGAEGDFDAFDESGLPF